MTWSAEITTNGAVATESCHFHLGLREEAADAGAVGETCYEGHMQQGFGDVQRHFWRNMLSGAAGHTYGAAGIWHAGVEGDHGNWGAWNRQPYDWTTWKEGMNYPGSTQPGLGKKLLEKYPWSSFEPHPEWAPGCHAAGIPGEVRFVYLPRRNIYNWDGPEVKDLEPDVDWHVYYFDPATGRKFDQGTIKATAKSWRHGGKTGQFQEERSVAAGLGAGPRKQRKEVKLPLHE